MHRWPHRHDGASLHEERVTGKEDEAVRASGQDPGRGGGDRTSYLRADAPASEALGEKVPHVADQVLVLEERHH